MDWQRSKDVLIFVPKAAEFFNHCSSKTSLVNYSSFLSQRKKINIIRTIVTEMSFQWLQSYLGLKLWNVKLKFKHFTKYNIQHTVHVYLYIHIQYILSLTYDLLNLCTFALMTTEISDIYLMCKNQLCRGHVKSNV